MSQCYVYTKVQYTASLVFSQHISGKSLLFIAINFSSDYFLTLVLFTFCTCCILRCLVCIVVSCLVCIVVSCLVCIVVVVLCVFAVLCVYCCFFTLDAGLLAISQYSEGPATGHLDTGFCFPCV